MYFMLFCDGNSVDPLVLPRVIDVVGQSLFIVNVPFVCSAQSLMSI